MHQRRKSPRDSLYIRVLARQINDGKMSLRDVQVALSTIQGGWRLTEKIKRSLKKM